MSRMGLHITIYGVFNIREWGLVLYNNIYILYMMLFGKQLSNTYVFLFVLKFFSCRRLSNIDFIYSHSHDFTCFNIIIVSKNSSISVWDDDDDDWCQINTVKPSTSHWEQSFYIIFLDAGRWIISGIDSLNISIPTRRPSIRRSRIWMSWKPGLLCLTSAEKMMKKWRTRSSLLKTSMQSSKNLRCHLNSWAHNLSERYASKTDVDCMSSGQFFAIAEYPMNSEDIWVVYSDICTDWCITERYLFHDSRSNKIMIRHLQTSNEYKFQFMIN